MGRALVLGGGGVTGIAWEVGVIAGLAETGIDVRDVDLVIGTSAGAAVAAQITSGEPLDALVARQRTPASESKEIAAVLDLEVLGSIFATLLDADLEPDERRARVGTAALAADTVSEPVRLEAIAARLPRDEWPPLGDRRVLLTAVDAASGAFVTFDASSGVALVDAVAASCAVPGIWPPVTIDGRRYVDGGVRSATNADLATGFEEVLVLTPMDPALVVGQASELAALEASGSAVAVVQADPAALEAMGDNPLDPERRGAAVDQGLRQGREAAAALGAAWIRDARR
jgi:NTE family protein